MLDPTSLTADYEDIFGVAPDVIFSPFPTAEHMRFCKQCLRSREAQLIFADWLEERGEDYCLEIRERPMRFLYEVPIRYVPDLQLRAWIHLQPRMPQALYIREELERRKIIQVSGLEAYHGYDATIRRVAEELRP